MIISHPRRAAGFRIPTTRIALKRFAFNCRFAFSHQSSIGWEFSRVGKRFRPSRASRNASSLGFVLSVIPAGAHGIKTNIPSTTPSMKLIFLLLIVLFRARRLIATAVARYFDGFTLIRQPNRFPSAGGTLVSVSAPLSPATIFHLCDHLPSQTCATRQASNAGLIHLARSTRRIRQFRPTEPFSPTAGNFWVHHGAVESIDHSSSPDHLPL